MLKRGMYTSGILHAAGVVFSIVGAALGLLVLLYWAMLYTEQFEILVLSPSGEATAQVVPWLAILLYLFGCSMRWMAGERITPWKQSWRNFVLAPIKYYKLTHLMHILGWSLTGSKIELATWMHERGLDYCLVATRQTLSGKEYLEVTVVTYADIKQVEEKVRWAYIPTADINAATQCAVLENQLNTQLYALFINR